MFGSGYSCTSVSALNCNRKENRGCVQEASANPTATGSTAVGAIEYTETHVPPVFVLESVNELSVVITGNTWNFRTRLDTFGVSGGYTGTGQDRKYFRVLKNVEFPSTLPKALQD